MTRRLLTLGGVVVAVTAARGHYRQHPCLPGNGGAVAPADGGAWAAGSRTGPWGCKVGPETRLPSPR